MTQTEDNHKFLEDNMEKGTVRRAICSHSDLLEEQQWDVGHGAIQLFGTNLCTHALSQAVSAELAGRISGSLSNLRRGKSCPRP